MNEQTELENAQIQAQGGNNPINWDSLFSNLGGMFTGVGNMAVGISTAVDIGANGQPTNGVAPVQYPLPTDTTQDNTPAQTQAPVNTYVPTAPKASNAPSNNTMLYMGAGFGFLLLVLAFFAFRTQNN